MPRPSRQASTKENSKIGTSAPTKKQQNKWVFVAKDNVLTDGGEPESKPSVCKLRHPRMDAGVLFLVSGDCKSVSELNVFDDKYHSWFIGETVHSGNQIYFASPIDPLFLVLPYLINAGKSNRFMSLEQIVEDEEFPDCQRILSCSGLDHAGNVADVKDIDADLKVFRYNKDKTLKWLEKKVNVLADVLEKKQVDVSAKSSQSSLFVRGKNSVVSKDAYSQYAFGMIKDYLSVEQEGELKGHLGLPDVEQKPSVDTAGENEPPNKKVKLSGDLTPIDDYSAGKDLKKDKSKAGKLTTAQKKLSKVDKSGMKSISSFFSPKS